MDDDGRQLALRRLGCRRGFPPVFRAAVALSLTVLGLALGGCQKEEAAPSPGSPTNAPAVTNAASSADYLGAVARGQKAATKVASLVGVQQAIKMFQVQEGRFPNTLQELVSEDYLPRLPAPPPGMKFDYNPATGEIRVVPQN